MFLTLATAIPTQSAPGYFEECRCCCDFLNTVFQRQTPASSERRKASLITKGFLVENSLQAARYEDELVARLIAPPLPRFCE